MNRLDREGIFKARPVSWKVQPSKQSQSVGINVEFQIVAQLVDGVDANGDKVSTWESWEEFEPHNCYGTFWVIGKTGQQNVTAIDQLVVSGLWNGDLKAVLGPVPEIVVQITVKAEDYNGQTYYKASWLNPEDHVPGPGGAGRDEVEKLSSQFGSLLRAAAAGAKKGAKPPAPKPSAPAAAAPSKPATATAAVAEPGANDGPDISGWTRKAAIARLGEAPDSKVQSAINDAGLSGVVKTRTQVAGLDDEALKRFDNALFYQDTPF